MSTDTPLHIEIYQNIKLQIMNKELSQGARLPTEHNLADSFGVSRLTVHKALQRLAQEGWIFRHRGKGSFVANRSVTKTTNLLESTRVDKSNETLIGFVLPGTSTSYGADLLMSVVSAVNEANMSAVINLSGRSLESEERAIQRTLNTGVKGLLIYPVNGEYHNEEILRLSLNRFPLVLVDRSLAKIALPYVCSDNLRASFELTAYLLQLGHERIGYISPEISGTVPLEERFTGHMNALRDHGLAEYEYHLNISLPTGTVLENVEKQNIYNTLTSYLLDHPDMTAIIATEYQYAVILMEICISLGISVPADMSIVCFDSPESDAYSFTHIKQDELEIGRSSVRMLMELMRNHKNDEPGASTSITLPATLVIGKTSTSPRDAGGELR